MRLMAGMKLLKERMDAAKHHDGVQHNVHHDHTAAAVPAKDKILEYAEMIKIRALSEIVELIYSRLYREHYARMRRLEVLDFRGVHLTDNKYPTVEQRNQASKI
jgi:hypothetical protein